MTYSLTEILAKLGAPEVEEREHVRWYYFKKENTEIGGFAEIRLEDDGRRLVAELRHWKESVEDDDGLLHDTKRESFYLHAVRPTDNGRFRVTKISFDDEDYTHPEKGIIELGASIFHARALEISILMMEESLKKQSRNRKPGLRQPRDRATVPQTKNPVQGDWGVVVPFQPRTASF